MTIIKNVLSYLPKDLQTSLINDMRDIVEEYDTSELNKLIPSIKIGLKVKVVFNASESYIGTIVEDQLERLRYRLTLEDGTDKWIRYNEFSLRKVIVLDTTDYNKREAMIKLLHKKSKSISQPYNDHLSMIGDSGIYKIEFLQPSEAPPDGVVVHNWYIDVVDGADRINKEFELFEVIKTHRRPNEKVLTLIRPIIAMPLIGQKLYSPNENRFRIYTLGYWHK